MDISPDRFALLYSVYSFPNMILPFIGGIVMDRVRFRSVFHLWLTSQTAAVPRHAARIAGMLRCGDVWFVPDGGCTVHSRRQQVLGHARRPLSVRVRRLLTFIPAHTSVSRLTHLLTHSLPGWVPKSPTVRRRSRSPVLLTRCQGSLVG